MSMVEVFITNVGQMTTANDFIIHGLLLDFNHLDRVSKDLDPKIILLFQDEPQFFYGIIYLCYLFDKNEFHILLKYMIWVLEISAG